MTIRKCKSSDLDPNRPKSEQVWCLYSKKSGKVLGRHPTKERALKQEKAIEISKHASSEVQVIKDTNNLVKKTTITEEVYSTDSKEPVSVPAVEVPKANPEMVKPEGLSSVLNSSDVDLLVDLFQKLLAKEPQVVKEEPKVEVPPIPAKTNYELLSLEQQRAIIQFSAKDKLWNILDINDDWFNLLQILPEEYKKRFSELMQSLAITDPKVIREMAAMFVQSKVSTQHLQKAISDVWCPDDLNEASNYLHANGFVENPTVQINLQASFRELLEICAGKVDDLKKKYPKDSEVIDFLSSKDPSTTNKYLEWMLKQVKSGFEAKDVVASIAFFHKNNQRFDKKDINSYASLSDLIKVISNLGEVSKTKQRSVSKATGADKLHEDETYVLYYIKSKEASICYGAGTKWCTTSKDEPHFEHYNLANVVIYYLINKTLPPENELSKIAFVFIRDDYNKITSFEIYDVYDKQLSSVPSGLESFSEIVHKDVQRRPMNTKSKVFYGKASPEEIDLFYKSANIHELDLIYNKFGIDNIDPKYLIYHAKSNNSKIRNELAQESNNIDVLLYMLPRETDYYVFLSIIRELDTANLDIANLDSKYLLPLINSKDVDILAMLAKIANTDVLLAMLPTQKNSKVIANIIESLIDKIGIDKVMALIKDLKEKNLLKWS